MLATLLGVSEHSRSYGHFEAEEVPVVSRSGPQQVAYDGEMGEKATEFRFRKRADADRLLLPHRLTGLGLRGAARRSR